jgi:hypothetical protein
MSEDELENRKAKQNYLKTWLQNLGKAKELVPRVQRELEKTEWEIEALSNKPDEASEIPTGDMGILFQNDFNFLTQSLPMILDFDAKASSTSDAFTTSGTASVYEFVARVGDIDTPNALEYSKNYTARYQVIQAAHNLPNQIRSLLERLPTKNTLDRFDRAEKSYLTFKADSSERTSAAIEMRTFIDGLQGDLFKLARRREKENMTWTEMAKRLSKAGATGLEYSEIMRQESVRASLIARLSTIGKDREGGSLTDLNNIWSELLDHAFTILNLINL